MMVSWMISVMARVLLSALRLFWFGERSGDIATDSSLFRVIDLPCRIIDFDLVLVELFFQRLDEFMGQKIFVGIGLDAQDDGEIDV